MPPIIVDKMRLGLKTDIRARANHRLELCGARPHQTPRKRSAPAPPLRITPHSAYSALCGAPHKAEIGAAWSKRSNEGRDYLSLKLDDPSFNAPIYANLFDDEDGEGYTLIWSRPRKSAD